MRINRQYLTQLVKRNRRRLLAVPAILVLLLAGYGLYLQCPATKVARTCGGLLDVDSVLDLTGHSRWSLIGYANNFDVTRAWQYDLETDPIDEPEGLAQRCDIEDITFQVQSSGGSFHPHIHHGFDAELTLLPVPIGSGWQGLLDVHEGWGAASVLLDCRNWSRQEEGGGLHVSIARVDEVSKETPLKLARAVTRSAVHAADKLGCETTPGEPITSLPATSTPRVVSAEKATGTRKSMRASPVARRSRRCREPRRGWPRSLPRHRSPPRGRLSIPGPSIRR